MLKWFKTCTINIFYCKYQIIEKEVAKKFNQEPVIAPIVKANELWTSLPNETLPNEEKKKESRCYLFENIDASLLKADDECLARVYAEMKQKKETWLKNRENFRISQLKLNALERVSVKVKLSQLAKTVLLIVKLLNGLFCRRRQLRRESHGIEKVPRHVRRSLCRQIKRISRSKRLRKRSR